MVKEILAGFPCEIERKGDELKLKFFPKNPDAKYPNSAVIILPLGKEDRKKFLKILSDF